ncbi:MAG TPA: hypothetical protein VGD66_12785 [Allosphingosinicella sp.]|jgi:hypothetical protein
MPDESAPVFKVSIDGKDLSFTREVDEPTLARVMHVMLTGSLPPDIAMQEALDSTIGQPDLQAGKKLSLREFLMTAGAKRYPDKIVAIGCFLEEHEGKSGFTKDDIKSRFRTAGESPPGNFPRDFSIAVSRGWIAEDPVNARQLYVTRSGREAVADGFSNALRQPRRRNTRRRRPALLTYQHV